MNVCPFCGAASYGAGRHQCVVGMAGFKMPGTGDEGSKKAKRSVKEIQKVIAKAAATQAAATESAAKTGLKAQQVHERGEMARTRTATLLKWGVVAGGILLTGLIAFGAIAAARKKKGRN